MANDATNVLVGATGKIYGGGSTLPTDATTAPHVSYNDYGYVSDGGATMTVGTTITDIKAWGGDIVRSIRSEHKVSISLEFLETTATEAVIKNVGGLRQKWIIDTIDGDNTLRLVIPDGEIGELGDLVLNTEEAIKYPVTITCYPDGSDNKVYIYRDTGA
jgi:hypothetical protein